MNTIDEVKEALLISWGEISKNCLTVLGSELHYQAMVYHYLLTEGSIPISQIGMNVKTYIENPISKKFKELDLKKNISFRCGFETIPDVVIFKPEINRDWRRRNNLNTLTKMLVAIEIKASERHNSRLSPKEIITDLEKLDAHREEAICKGGELLPIMLIIDSAPNTKERMTSSGIEKFLKVAKDIDIGVLYCSLSQIINTVDNSK